MCGIAGSIRFREPAPPLDLELLQHRGPDGSGEWRSLDQRVWLGHTRLAILDLSTAGSQPMVDPSSGVVLVFNGEIYNHLDIRRELSARGWSWRGGSDSETLLAAYQEWGKGCLRRLEGMFAFAIFDPARRGLLLTRDRFGIKPLYWMRDSQGASFCSEVRPLIAMSDAPLHPSRVVSYLSKGCCPETHLLFEGLESIPAGEWAWIPSEGGLQSGRYWQALPAPEGNTRHPAQTVRELLEDSVRAHLLSDVPVACFLSGGLDSSVLTGLAAKMMSEPLRTFSVGFRESKYHEGNFAAQVAAHCGSLHEEIVLDPDETLLRVREAVARMDLPSVDAINTYIVAKAVADRGIKVALSGLGADELFGGYPSFRQVPWLKWAARLSGPMKHLARWIPHGERLAELSSCEVEAIAQWRRRFWTRSMLHNAGLEAELETGEGQRTNPELPDDFARISWSEMSGYMREMLLRDADQMSMAVSLELRVPFLARELVEYVLFLPQSHKRPSPSPKQLLVDACRDRLPEGILTRPKQGFGLPMREWMSGPLRGLVIEGMEGVSRRGLIAPSFLERLQLSVDEKTTHWTRLWSVVVLGLYLDRVESPAAVLAN